MSILFLKNNTVVITSGHQRWIPKGRFFFKKTFVILRYLLLVVYVIIILNIYFNKILSSLTKTILIHVWLLQKEKWFILWDPLPMEKPLLRHCITLHRNINCRYYFLKIQSNIVDEHTGNAIIIRMLGPRTTVLEKKTRVTLIAR